MFRYLTCLSIVFATFVIGGCVRGPLPTGDEGASTVTTASDPEQQKLLEGILENQKDTGLTLEALSKEIARRAAMESQAVGPSPLQRDSNVARGLLVATRRAVNAEDWDAATLNLNRLEATLGVMLAETPSAQIRTYLERAVFALQGSTLGVEADVASACVLAALDVALTSGDAPLVPDIAGDLEKTKTKIDKGSYKEGLQSVEEFIGVVAGHSSIKLLEAAAAGVRGAREAMAREAGLVVLAELDQLSDLLNRFGTMVKAAPPATTESAATETETEAEAETGTAPAESAQEQPAEAGSEEPTAETEATSAEAEKPEPAATPARRRSRR